MWVCPLCRCGLWLRYRTAAAAAAAAAAAVYFLAAVRGMVWVQFNIGDNFNFVGPFFRDRKVKNACKVVQALEHSRQTITKKNSRPWSILQKKKSTLCDKNPLRYLLKLLVVFFLRRGRIHQDLHALFGVGICFGEFFK